MISKQSLKHIGSKKTLPKTNRKLQALEESSPPELESASAYGEGTGNRLEGSTPAPWSPVVGRASLAVRKPELGSQNP